MFKNLRIGIAPLTWTNDDMPELGGYIPFEQCINEMAEAGYDGCEIGNKFPKTTAAMLEALSPLGLSIASQWCSIYFTLPERQEESLREFKKQLLFLKKLGAKRINLCEQSGSIQAENVPLLGDHKPIFSEAQWQLFVNNLNKAGDIAKAYDMQISYHHHMGTGVQTHAELDRLMQETDPDVVGLLLDTGHLVYAGIDPLDTIARYGKRINHVHLKDLRSSQIQHVHKHNLSFLDGIRAGTFTVPGDGLINFEPILHALATYDYSGWLIVEAEQDPNRAHPLTYAKKGRQYIHSIIGV